jgi:hypothetical protein
MKKNNSDMIIVDYPDLITTNYSSKEIQFNLTKAFEKLIYKYLSKNYNTSDEAVTIFLNKNKINITLDIFNYNENYKNELLNIDRKLKIDKIKSKCVK